MPLVPPGAASTAATAAIRFLSRAQLPHGEFATFASAVPEMRDCEPAPSIFTTTLVLHCLRLTSDPLSLALRAKGLAFVESEMEMPGVWRFWSSGSDLYRALPPDLDDTCCASFVLRLYGRPVPPNEDVLLANTTRDGSFYTWLSPVRDGLDRTDAKSFETYRDLLTWVVLSSQWNDVDPVVNANLVLYLGEGVRTSGARAYLIQTVERDPDQPSSRYYPGPLVFYYMLARATALSVPSLGCVRDTVLRRTIALRRKDGSFGGALATALAANVLLSYEQRIPALTGAIDWLVAAQQPDGSWAREPLFADPSRYYGSAELTTALCLEALAQVGVGREPRLVRAPGPADAS